MIHIRHADADPASPLSREAPGYQVMPCAQELATESVFIKSTSSAFASTTLEKYLRDCGITQLLVTGAVAGFCVNSTVRAGADLGFRMTVIHDAVMGFDVPPSPLSAQTIFDATMALLAADFATLIDTASVLAMYPV
ncbi:isochorismatase family protein [Erwinia sp. V71]|uniref:isochorismatase family protein n=1 Tax=Erwinia sp. V71 TaxID=3369424 RepID=UPI003F5DDF1A